MRTTFPATFPEILPYLGDMSREHLDSLDFGVVKVSAAGVIEIYNRYESELAGVPVAKAEGRNFFTQIAPCTNNRLILGRFKEGVAAGSLNVSIPYTFTYKMKPTNVKIHLYHDASSQTNWLLIHRR